MTATVTDYRPRHELCLMTLATTPLWNARAHMSIRLYLNRRYGTMIGRHRAGDR